MLALFAALSCAPLAALLIRAGGRGETFVGPGASLAIGDQYRYLGWIRDASGHGLIAAPGTAHVYFNPLFLVSGLLLRAGVSIQVAYQLWLPVAIAALFFGYRALVWRLVAPGPARPVTLALALMASSPLLPALDYGKVVDANGAAELINTATHLSPYWQAWGYFPTAIALGLMPLYVLGLRRSGLHPARLAMLGAVVSLLDPWAGLGLAVITVLDPARSRRTLVTPLLSTLAPLLYYALLARSNAAWSLSELRNSFSPQLWTLPIVLGPLLVGVWLARREHDQSLLWIWLLASVLLFLVLRSDARLTVLEGTSLPLAVLAVRGWRRLRLPRAASALVVVLLTLPGAAYAGATLHDYVNDRDAPWALAGGELHAIHSLPPHATIITSSYLAPALYALTGRSATAGPSADALLDGRLTPSATAALLARTRATAVLSDCIRGRAELGPLLARFGFTEQRHGCARLYLSRPSGPDDR